MRQLSVDTIVKVLRVVTNKHASPPETALTLADWAIIRRDMTSAEITVATWETTPRAVPKDLLAATA